MKTPQKHWLFSEPKTSHVEAVSSLFYFFFEFVQQASPDDFRTMLKALLAWSEHPEIDGWFTTSFQQLCGVPVIEKERGGPRTLRQLRDAAQKRPANERAEFVAAHLDLIGADYYERATLTLCQKILRETRGHGSRKRLNLSIDELMQQASSIVLDDSINGTDSKVRRDKKKPQRSATAA